jgi:DNA-directed RNA polymerase subunit RPC12/RpoP
VNNDDLISRQAALDDAHRQLWYRMNQQGMKDRIDEWLKNLPPAEPEQKTGHWIANEDYDGEVYYTCSRCEEPWATIDGTPQENGMRYCPHCGAKMEGETE